MTCLIAPRVPGKSQPEAAGGGVSGEPSARTLAAPKAVASAPLSTSAASAPIVQRRCIAPPSVVKSAGILNPLGGRSPAVRLDHHQGLTTRSPDEPISPVLAL